MSLNFDFTAIPDYEELTATPEARTLTDAIIWATMFTGIGTLTEDNITEFYARLIIGRYWVEAPSFAEVQRYVGLKTNVFPTETRAKWLKRVMGGQLDTEVRAATREMAKAVAS